MGDPEFVPRTEFEMLCHQINGSLTRIEAGVDSLRQGQNSLQITISSKVDKTYCDRCMDSAREERKELAKRVPGWVSVMIPLLTAIVTALIMLVVTGVIR